jgi:hypothetical protein
VLGQAQEGRTTFLRDPVVFGARLPTKLQWYCSVRFSRNPGRHTQACLLTPEGSPSYRLRSYRGHHRQRDPRGSGAVAERRDRAPACHRKGSAKLPHSHTLPTATNCFTRSQRAIVTCLSRTLLRSSLSSGKTSKYRTSLSRMSSLSRMPLPRSSHSPCAMSGSRSASLAVRA